MRWALKQSLNQLHYWSLEDGGETADLKYNNSAHSLRITSGERRLFFLEKTGFLQTRFLVRTEYSVVTGETYSTKNPRSGFLMIDGEKFSYSFRENELTLSSKREGLAYSLEIDQAGTLDPFEICALIFGTARVLSKIKKPRTNIGW